MLVTVPTSLPPCADLLSIVVSAVYCPNFHDCHTPSLLALRVWPQPTKRPRMFVIFLTHSHKSVCLVVVLWKVWDYRTGRVVSLQQPRSRVFEWLVVVAPLPVALTLFMWAAALLVALFLGYQLWMIAQVGGWQGGRGAYCFGGLLTEADRSGGCV